MVWVGPSPESIESFGIKHTARDLATRAGVPVVPGTKGLVDSEDEAVTESERLGFPVMLKATAGGGGMDFQLVRMWLKSRSLLPRSSLVGKTSSRTLVFL